MDRRDSLKSILAIGLGTGLLMGGCKPAETVDKDAVAGDALPGYGRTEAEKARDAKLMAETFFNEHEMKTLGVLCGLILPASGQLGSATDAGVPDFIEFIAKDMPHYQLPLRGGLMWLDNRANRRFEKDFVSCAAAQQTQLLDEIAYPDRVTPEVEQGAKFFELIRNLTVTGYYTSPEGFEDLGFVGNRPNVWDGVPADILKDHDVDYEPEWLTKCIDQSTRDQIAEWDEEGNLLG